MNQRDYLERNIALAVLLLGVVSLSFISIVHPGDEKVAQAQSPTDKICVPPSWPPARVIHLIEKISRAESADKPRGEFRKAEFIITLEGNELVCLASTIDGRGDLWVDDFLEFHVTRQDQTVGGWTHDFYAPTIQDLEKIKAYPAQDITRLFKAGSNAGYIRLIDFFPPWYSASPVWLIIWGPRPTSTPTSTFTATPTSTPTHTFTPTPTKTPTLTPTPTPPVPAELGEPNIPLSVLDRVGPPPIDEWLQLMSAPIEQGRPFQVTIPIRPQSSTQLVSVTAFVTNSEGEVVLQNIPLTKQRRTDIFESQVPGIAQTGVYTMTFRVEGIDATGRKNSIEKEKSFVVGWPLWTRPIRFLVALLVVYLFYLLTLKPLLAWLFFRDLGKRLVIGELHVKWPPEKKHLNWNLSGNLAKELGIGIDSGDIALPSLSNDPDAPRGVFGKLKGNLENRRHQIAPLVVSTTEQVPILVNGEPAPKEKKGAMWAIFEFLLPLPQKPKGITLANGSIIELGGYNLEYVLREEI